MMIGDQTPNYNRVRYDELQTELTRLSGEHTRISREITEVQQELAAMFVQPWDTPIRYADRVEEELHCNHRRQEPWAEDP